MQDIEPDIHRAVAAAAPQLIVMNTTRDQLKAMPAFTYPADHHPGDVYSSKAIRDRGTGTSSMPGNR